MFGTSDMVALICFKPSFYPYNFWGESILEGCLLILFFDILRLKVVIHEFAIPPQVSSCVSLFD